MEIDIRCVVEEPTIIKFSDAKKKGHSCQLLSTKGNEQEPVWIDDAYEDFSVAIHNKEDAENLIKALQYAIHKGWFNK